MHNNTSKLPFITASFNEENVFTGTVQTLHAFTVAFFINFIENICILNRTLFILIEMSDLKVNRRN